MKRRLLIIAVFLLLGAVVNVAVAWGCAAFVPGTRSGSAAALDDPRARDFVGSRRYDRAAVWEWSGYGHDTLLVACWTAPSPIGDAESQHTTRAGLPLRCLVGRHQSEYGPAGTLGRSERYVGAWPVLPRVGPLNAPRFLPLHAIWPGFFVNTLFYATLLWLLIPGPFALRRLLRLRRGLCPKCAYPMGESSVCTECGRALPKRVAT